MKYRQYLAGGQVMPDEPKKKLTPDEERRLAASFARYNPGHRGPYGPQPEMPLEPNNIVFDAMLGVAGLRGLAAAVKRPPREWMNIPEGPDKELAREIGEMLFRTGTKLK
jgi:hypothetical protein